MIRTPLCELLGIDLPIIQAGMGGNATSAELASAVTNAGAMGSIGAGGRPLDNIRRDLQRIGDLTGGSFAVSHMVTILDRAAFDLTIETRPKAVTFAMDDGGELMKQAHDAGVLVIQQVCTAAQAEAAAEHGADVIIAQGGEAGGFGGSISTMTLVPQVVDAVSPLPVVAAGGISDGRGLAAALMLGAQGINIGTRFLTSKESPIDDEWKQSILHAASQDSIKAEVFNDFSPLPGRPGYGTVPRSLRTEFLDHWMERREEARANPDSLRAEFGKAAATGTGHRLLPWAGQTAGAITDIRPAADIVAEIARQAEQLLTNAGRVVVS
jgi:nitronate monooxygenase/enoyl-[acyl-carrier protein] reductase II